MTSFNNAINNTVGGSNSGVSNTLTITNSSNTASSAANVQVTVGGGTAADPQTTYTVTGATSWSTGIDNSASDAYVIAASTALGTTNVISMATGGAVSVVLGNFDVTRSASGADVSGTISNTSNTASSTATQYLTVAGSSAGDAQVQYAVSGTTTWTEGVDNSDSDAFVLSRATTLGTSNNLRFDSNGGQYKGYNNNTAPPAGFLGEYISSFVNHSAPVSINPSGTTINVTSISLTAGIWDISVSAEINGQITTGVVAISTTSASLPGNSAQPDSQVGVIATPTANGVTPLSIPAYRVTLSSTTTYYLVAYSTFTVGTSSAAGRISATRVG